MNINFKELELFNFMSFGHASVSLDNNGYVRVYGENNNLLDMAESNGSGKSSLWEALFWALTGSTIRGVKDIVNHFANDGCYVRLDFTIDTNSYSIIRSKEHSKYKTNLQIFINGENKSGKGIRDSEKLLNEYLPDLNPQLIGSVILLGQGLPHRFTNNTPSGRKEVLEKLSKSDFMIEDIKNRISNRSSELSRKMREYEDNILSLNTKKSTLEQSVRETQNRLKYLKPIDELKNSLEEAHINYHNKELLVTETTNKIQGANKRYAASNERLRSINDAIMYVNNEESNKLNSIKDDNIDLTVEKIELEKSNLNDLMVKSRSLELDINKKKNVKDTCPTCGQKIPNVKIIDTSEDEKLLSSYKSEVDLIRNKISDLSAELKLLRNNVDAEKERIRSIYRDRKNELMSEYKMVQGETTKIGREIGELNSTLNIFKNDIINQLNIISTFEKNVNDYEITKKTCEDVINSANKSIGEIENNLLYISNDKEDTQLHIDVINKFNTAVKRDFRGYLLSSSIEFINKRSKEYCMDIFETTDIEFKLDGNNISITYTGKEYEGLSGGERQKIDLIVQFAIRDMLCTYLNFSSNILILDEITDSLDSVGCQRVINFISSKLSDVNSIYIISHRKDIDIPYDKQLIVVKNNDGVSYIKNDIL